MKLPDAVIALALLIVISCFSTGAAAQDPPPSSLSDLLPAFRRCEVMENKKLLLHQQFKSSKICKESVIGKGWTDCSFKAYGTEVLLVGAIGTTVGARMRGFRGSGFYILSVDPQAKVRTIIDEDFGTLIRVDGKDNLKESGCFYNEAYITLDAQVYGPGEFKEVKYGPVKSKLPKTEKEKTKALQKDLKMLGYYAGKIDGVLGPQTITAIERYKSVEGLPKETTIENVSELVTLNALQKSLDNLKRLHEELVLPKPPLRK